MKTLSLKKFGCASALALAPLTALAGGTNSGDDASTGYGRDPDRAMEQGDMGATGVGQRKDAAPGAGAPQVDDSALARQVREALKTDAMLKKLDIKVAAKDGTVTLEGDARDVRWQARALMVASSVKGVKSVQNNLTVGTQRN